jgi:hypothetical protein
VVPPLGPVEARVSLEQSIGLFDQTERRPLPMARARQRVPRPSAQRRSSIASTSLTPSSPARCR